MENASKALIIAGAILLAILLISLGIFIFTQAQDVVSTSGLTQAEMQAFNNKFLKYEGTKTGAEVKAMINEIIVSNADDNNKSRQVHIKIIGTHSGPVLPTSTSGISISQTYTVTARISTGAGDSDWKTQKGLVWKMDIQ